MENNTSIPANENEPHFRILVAEDNPSNYKLVEVLLRRTYELVHAWDGQQAIELYAEGRFDLVLMDINMPVLDGYGALLGIRKINPDAQVVALTAYAFETDRERMFNAGFTDCLAKPLTPGDFQQKIYAYLNR